MQKFICSPDKLSKIRAWSIAAFAFILAIIFYFYFSQLTKNPSIGLVVFVAFIPVYIGMFLAYFHNPESIEITGTTIIIRRKITPRRILFSDINSIRKAEEKEMKGVIRASTSEGGLYGYTGLYWNRKMGDMWWYCSQRKNYIIIDTNDDTRIVITPDYPEEFMKNLPAEFSGLSLK